MDTPIGELSFEEYFVQRWYQDPVKSIRFAGIENAEPAPGVIDAIMSATVVLLAPSNPVTSIGPILAVPGIAEALKQTRALVAAVSPIIGNTAVSGPAGILMAAQGLPVSIAGVAQAYREFLDLLVVDHRDAKAAEELRQSGLRVHCANTIMGTADEKIDLARQVLARSIACIRKRRPRGLGPVMILVPVKNLSGAKQRLAALFDQPSRTELAQAMLADVLETLGAWTDRPEVGSRDQRSLCASTGPAISFFCDSRQRQPEPDRRHRDGNRPLRSPGR